MHRTSFDEMGRLLKKHLGDRFHEPLEVLDVGSRQVEDGFGKTYRDLMPRAWRYVGCDVVPGPNVDLVCLGPYRIRQASECYDLVISGQSRDCGTSSSRICSCARWPACAVRAAGSSSPPPGSGTTTRTPSTAGASCRTGWRRCSGVRDLRSLRPI